MESPESQLSNFLFFVEFWLNRVIFVEFSNRDLRFPKLHENNKILNFGCIFIMKFTKFTQMLWNFRNFEIAITVDGDVLRRRFFNRLKALNLSFPICYFSLNFDLRNASKSRVRSDSSYFRIGLFVN